jgi:lipopolysaccharide/colanic/teichoic acid biosynthesis glycosyltransferase
MNVLIVHQYFATPNESGGTRHYELAQHLIRCGNRVTIVASDTSYFTGKRVVPRARLMTEEQLDGIRLLRAYSYPSLHRSFAWRAFALVVFAVTSVWAALRAGRVDVVMSTTPPIFQPLSAWLVALVRRRPFLLEVRDLWPEFAIGLGVLKNRFLIFLARLLERFLYARATHILVNSPAYRDYLIGRGVAPGRISLVANGVDPAMFDPAANGQAIRDEFNLGGRFVATYAGALGLANDVGTILRAAAKLQDDPDIRVLVVGDGKDRAQLERQASEERLTNAIFAGGRPKCDMPAVLAASDVCLATLQDIPMFRTTYPNKVFDYMAAGRPTVLAIDGVIREVIETARSGIYVQPGDAEALAAAVRRLKSDPAKAREMGRRAREHVVRHFNRHDQAQQFVELLESLAGSKRTFYQRFGKRAFDLALTLPAIVVLSPLMLVLSIVVAVRLRRPIFFRQQRTGQGGRPFRLVKFRTMVDQRDVRGELLPDDARLTPLGRWLRATSLDELPTLLNVVAGSMSLVGPRPLPHRYAPRYSAEENRRHDVPPGVTGWAQTNGRNAISWEEKFRLDAWYVERQSFWLDLKILFLTVWKVLRREGISAAGEATMPEFYGNQSTLRT